MGKPTGLAKEQRRALDRLKDVPGIDRFYLQPARSTGGMASCWFARLRRGDLNITAEVDGGGCLLSGPIWGLVPVRTASTRGPRVTLRSTE